MSPCRQPRPRRLCPSYTLATHDLHCCRRCRSPTNCSRLGPSRPSRRCSGSRSFRCWCSRRRASSSACASGPAALRSARRSWSTCGRRGGDARAQRLVQPVVPRATPMIARQVAGQPPATALTAAGQPAVGGPRAAGAGCDARANGRAAPGPGARPAGLCANRADRGGRRRSPILRAEGPKLGEASQQARGAANKAGAGREARGATAGAADPGGGGGGCQAAGLRRARAGCPRGGAGCRRGGAAARAGAADT